MLTPGGSPIKHGFHQTAAKLRTLIGKLPESRKTALYAIGVKTLGYAVQDYRARSAGKEAGGITWKPLAQSTLDRRVSKLGSYRRLKTKGAKQRAKAKASAKGKIGVDTGRLIASIVFGAPGNFMQVKNLSVIIGTGIQYGKWFDQTREIFPKTMIDAKRLAELEAIAARVYERASKDALS